MSKVTVPGAGGRSCHNPLDLAEQITAALQGVSVHDLQINTLEADIDRFVEMAIEAGEYVPDFWDEMNTSECLAEHLNRLGYRRIAVPR